MRVAVYPTVNGWRAKVYTENGLGREIQERVDEVVDDLNAFYDLASEITAARRSWRPRIARDSRSSAEAPRDHLQNFRQELL